jgi:signal transduction histidine kinase
MPVRWDESPRKTWGGINMASMTSDRWRAADASTEATPPSRARVSGEVPIPFGREVPRAVAEALGEIGVGCALIEASSERVVLANETLAQLVGRTASALMGRSFVEVIDPDDVDLARQRLRGVRAEDGPLALRLLHAEAHYLTAAVAFRGLWREAGSETVLMLVSPRVSRTEDSGLQAALDAAGESIRQREDLFALAAHELRSALTPPLLHLQAMARSAGRDPAATVRGLGIAVGQVKRVTGLVEQLLDVARVRAGRLTLRREVVDLSPIVRGVVARFGPESERSETMVEAACTGAVLGHWDPLRIDQIVTNLVSNAMKYGGHSPVIVTVSASRTHARLAVLDHGPGIPPGHQTRIFERFERANEDPSVAGSGLGLWIVRRLTEAHGGSVEVFSEPEQGSTFVVRLPFE